MLKLRINIDMNQENIHSSVSGLFPKQLNLLDFVLKNQHSKKIKEINRDIKSNKLLKFIKYVFK